MPAHYLKQVGDLRGVMASSAGFACAIAVFDKTWTGERMGYVNRDDLLADGQIMLDMINAKAMQSYVAA